MKRLSKRENEVMQLLCNGNTQKEIAFRFSLSYKTVNTHILRIKGKLGARNIAQATFLFLNTPGELEYKSWGVS